MSDAITDVIQVLTERGYRITGARRQVLTLLSKSTQPLTIQELAQQASVDEASVYRTIHLLLREDLVEEIVIKGSRPQFALAHHHHHHVVCRGCGLVAHVPCSAEVPTPQTKKFSTIDAHEVTFYGQCVSCDA